MQKLSRERISQQMINTKALMIRCTFPHFLLIIFVLAASLSKLLITTILSHYFRATTWSKFIKPKKIIQRPLPYVRPMVIRHKRKIYMQYSRRILCVIRPLDNDAAYSSTQYQHCRHATSRFLDYTSQYLGLQLAT